MVNIDYIKTLGNLPDTLSDRLINTINHHIEVATREIKKYLIVDTNVLTDEDLKVYDEAIGCFTMYLITPIMNTFYIEGLTSAMHETSESNFIFHNIDEVEKLQNIWKDRAFNNINILNEKYNDDVEDSNVNPFNMFSI